MAQSTTQRAKRAAANAVAAGEKRAGGPYRFWGAVSAVVFGLLFLWSIAALFDDSGTVAPEVRWTAAEVQGEPAEGTPYQVDALASDVLAARTQMQRDRQDTGPAPEGEVPAAAMGEGQRLVAAPMERTLDLPRAWAAPDAEMLELIRPRDTVIGTSNLPYVNANVFERPDARDWRMGMAEWATHVGAVLILGFCFLMSLMLAIKGRIPIARGRSGRSVLRFNAFERATHWMTAVSFIGLGLTGIVIGYGVTLFRPFGETVMSAMGWLSTWGHVMFAPPFALGVLAMLVMWVPGNIPNRLDWEWIRQGGGFINKHPSARRFNAGQKIIFWSAVAGGLVMVGTGAALMFPFWFIDIGWMGTVMLAHALLGVILIAVFLAHIYIGSVGQEGAFEAMWSGRVDRNWAAEHHDLWLEEMDRGTASGAQAPGPSPKPAGARS